MAQVPGVSLDRLRVFVAVIEHGGFTAAAQHLQLSQPTVSFHVRELERSYGATLLSAHGREQSLTPAGELVHAYARRVLGDEATTRRRVSSLEQGKAGQVRLGASLAFEQGFFFDEMIGPFLRGHKDVELSLVFDTSWKIAEAVRERAVDLGYVMGAPTPPDLRYERLHDSSVVFFVSDRHPLAAGGAPSAAEVAAAGLITAPMGTVEWGYYGQVLRAVRMRQYRVALEIGGMQARVLAAQCGLGVLVTFWPPYAGKAGLPGLRALPLPVGRDTGPEFGLVRRDDAPTDPPVRELISWLREVGHRRDQISGAEP